tara:strand:- start:1478 stop:2251 length:774 start_codon:yes stop_codon:yes gene_type:complete
MVYWCNGQGFTHSAYPSLEKQLREWSKENPRLPKEARASIDFVTHYQGPSTVYDYNGKPSSWSDFLRCMKKNDIGPVNPNVRRFLIEDTSSPMAGQYGIRSLENLRKHTIVGVYESIVVTNDTFYDIRKEFREKYGEEEYRLATWELHRYAIDLGESNELLAVGLPTNDHGSELCYINDGKYAPYETESHVLDRSPNVRLLTIYPFGFPLVIVLTTQSVAKNTELLLSYGEGYWKNEKNFRDKWLSLDQCIRRGMNT